MKATVAARNAAIVAGMIGLLAQPAIAAEDLRIDGGGRAFRTSAYGGLHLRMPIGGRVSAPKAGIAFGLLTNTGGRNAAYPARQRVAQIVSLDGSTENGLQLAIAGIEPKELGPKLGISSTGTVLLVVGALAVGGIVLAAASSGGGGSDDEPCFFFCD